MFKCYDCPEVYRTLEDIYEHILEDHPFNIPKDYSVERYYHYRKTGKTHGICRICKKATEWNDDTHKYGVFCNDPKCKEVYREQFKERMISKHGKVSLLDDPEQQRKMLENRSISGVYKWSDGSGTTKYTGSYELHFLQYLDVIFGFGAKDIMAPSPHNYKYMHGKTERFYFPDFFIPDLGLEIEIKDGGNNPNNHHKIKEVDKVKEKLKDDVLLSQKHFHYIKVVDKNPIAFLRFLEKNKELYGNDDTKSRIFITDNNTRDPKVIVKENLLESVLESININNGLVSRLEEV